MDKTFIGERNKEIKRRSKRVRNRVLGGIGWSNRKNLIKNYGLIMGFMRKYVKYVTRMAQACGILVISTCHLSG